MLVHLVQELLIDVFQITLVRTQCHILLIILNVVDIRVTTCAISAAMYASLARGTVVISGAHQISVAIQRIVVGLNYATIFLEHAGHRMMVDVVMYIVMVQREIFASMVDDDFVTSILGIGYLYGAIETCEMTFIVILIIRGIVIVCETVAEQLRAQIYGHLRFGVVQILLVLFVPFYIGIIVVVIVDSITLEIVLSIHAESEAEVLEDGRHGRVEICSCQHCLQFLVKVLVVECVRVEAFCGREEAQRWIIDLVAKIDVHQCEKWPFASFRFL